MASRSLASTQLRRTIRTNFSANHYSQLFVCLIYWCQPLPVLGDLDDDRACSGSALTDSRAATPIARSPRLAKFAQLSSYNRWRAMSRLLFSGTRKRRKNFLMLCSLVWIHMHVLHIGLHPKSGVVGSFVCLAWWVMRWDVIGRHQSTFLTILATQMTQKACNRNVSSKCQKLCKRYCYEIFTIYYYEAAFPLNTLISNINSKAVQKSCDVIIMLMTSNNGRRQSSLRSVRVRKRNRF